MINAENSLTLSLEKPDLLTLSGSRLYGSHTENSDYDYRGFILPPFEYLCGFNNFEHRVIREPDTVIYSLKRFVQLLISGDPKALEILFAPEPNIIERTGIGGSILHSKNMFVCKRFAKRILGYSQSEWRKVKVVQLVPVKRTTTEDQVIEDIRQIFSPKKEEMNEVCRILFAGHKREIRTNTRKLGDKRKKQINQYGYCVSSASHAIRLLGQLIEFMNTGKMSFPRPDSKFLSEIKKGKIDFKVVTQIYDDLYSDAIRAEQKSELPEKPPIKQINVLYNSIVANAMASDIRLINFAEKFRRNFGFNLEREY